MLKRILVPTPEVAALLRLAMWPDPERVRAELDAYRGEPGLQVWSWEVGNGKGGGRTVCAAGLHLAGTRAELCHLGTAADARGRGHARALLHALVAELELYRFR